MHKRIVKAIEFAITQESIHREVKDMFKIIIDEKKTGGFWKMKINLKPKYTHLISHIESIGVSIGRFYGEHLFVEKTNSSIKFS